MHTDLADDLPTVPRFMHSFRQCKALVVTHGVYTTYAGTTVFSRAPMERDSTKDATAKELALSFAAAQDCAGSAQIEGVSDEDLDVFRRLWESTIAALETVIEAGNLDHETLGSPRGATTHSSWRSRHVCTMRFSKCQTWTHIDEGQRLLRRQAVRWRCLQRRTGRFMSARICSCSNSGARSGTGYGGTTVSRLRRDGYATWALNRR
jgi:hypothetical protein